MFNWDFIDEEFQELLGKDSFTQFMYQFEEELKKIDRIDDDLHFDYELNANQNYWFNIHIRKYENHNKETYVASIYDITNRINQINRLNNELSLNRKPNDLISLDESRIKSIFKDLESLFIIWDEDSKVTYANKISLDFFNLDESEFIGKSWMDTIIPDLKDIGIDTVKHLKEVIEAPQNFSINHNHNKDSLGNIYYVRWSNIPFRNKKNEKKVLSIGDVIEVYNN